MNDLKPARFYTMNNPEIQLSESISAFPSFSQKVFIFFNLDFYMHFPHKSQFRHSEEGSKSENRVFKNICCTSKQIIR